MATSPIYSWPEPDNTDLVKNGALAIRTLGNAIDTTMGTMVAKTVVDAKGDLIAGTANDTVNRLAVGNNGETLVADSSTSTGLRYNANFAAGKNKIINGDFYWNQRNLTSQTTDGAYGFDRWRMYASSGGTYSAQTFTAGTAPVAGYEGKNFARIVTTGQSGASVYTSIDQPIEDVRTFAGQTITISFWAKAASGTPKVSVEVLQNFGSGGSGTTFTNGSAVTLSTSWARYSMSIAVPSITGATIGTGSNLDITFWVSAGTSFASRANSIGIQSNTFDFWGVQVEAGSVATSFQTATGTIQGELAACQRYYYRTNASGAAYTQFGFGNAWSTTDVMLQVKLPVTMRTKPATLETNALLASDGFTNLAITSPVLGGSSSPDLLFLTGTVSGATAYRPYQLCANASTSAYVGVSSEL